VTIILRKIKNAKVTII